MNISRLTGTDISLNGPAQKIFTRISRHTNVKDTVVEIWRRVHFLVAEAEGAVSCLNHFTLSSSRALIGTLRAGGTTAIAAGVVSCHLPRCSKLTWSGDYCSRWGAEVITLISIEVSTKSTCFSSV